MSCKHWAQSLARVQGMLAPSVPPSQLQCPVQLLLWWGLYLIHSLCLLCSRRCTKCIPGSPTFNPHHNPMWCVVCLTWKTGEKESDSQSSLWSVWLYCPNLKHSGTLLKPSGLLLRPTVLSQTQKSALSLSILLPQSSFVLNHCVTRPLNSSRTWTLVLFIGLSPRVVRFSEWKFRALN